MNEDKARMHEVKTPSTKFRWEGLGKINLQKFQVGGIRPVQRIGENVIKVEC